MPSGLLLQVLGTGVDLKDAVMGSFHVVSKNFGMSRPSGVSFLSAVGDSIAVNIGA